MKNNKVIFQDWGLLDYELAWSRQEALFSSVVDQKMANRSAAEPASTSNYLIFTQHPHVYTLGKSGKSENLLLDDSGLEEKHASFYKINRGGDITYHGPGQLVGYPILDLDNFFTDIHLYLRTLEEAIIQLLADYGLKGGRLEGFTGVWLDPHGPRARKICAMGVRCSRWVTMHGFALNVCPDLGYFGNIVPCGIDDKAVTSLEKELGHKPDMEEVKLKLADKIAALFGMDLIARTESA